MNNSKFSSDIKSNTSTNNNLPQSSSSSRQDGQRRKSQSPIRDLIFKPNIRESFKRQSKQNQAEMDEAIMFQKAWAILNTVREDNVQKLSNIRVSSDRKKSTTAKCRSKSQVPKSSVAITKKIKRPASLSPVKSRTDQKLKSILINPQAEVKTKDNVNEKMITDEVNHKLVEKNLPNMSTRPKSPDSEPSEKIPVTLREVVKDENIVVAGEANIFSHQKGTIVEDLLGFSNPYLNKALEPNTSSDSSSNQRENLNINLTLSMGQLGNGGYVYPKKTEDEGTNNDLPIRTLRIARSRRRVSSHKSETSIQTDLLLHHLKDGGTAFSDGVRGLSSNHEEVVTELFPKDFDNGSTSTFPSAVPSSQNWRRRQPKTMDTSLTQENLSDYINFSLPSVISYTGDLVKSLLATADQIINTCIIPPDDNPMTDEEMDKSEGKIVVSLMRLIGVPKQLRHNIYKESVHNLEALQDVSIGTIDVLNNVIDWIVDGDESLGREEILHKVRVLASITTDFNPGSDIWQQFEKDLTVFSSAACDKMKEGITIARKYSETVINKLNGPMDNAAAKILKSISNVCLNLPRSDEGRNKPVDVLVQNTFMEKGIWYGQGGVLLRKQQSFEYKKELKVGTRRSRSITPANGKHPSSSSSCSSSKTRCRSLGRKFGNSIENLESNDEEMAKFQEALRTTFPVDDSASKQTKPPIPPPSRDVAKTCLTGSKSISAVNDEVILEFSCDEEETQIHIS